MLPGKHLSYLEPVTERCSGKQVLWKFLKTIANFLLIKLNSFTGIFQRFCQDFQNIFFTECMPVTASCIYIALFRYYWSSLWWIRHHFLLLYSIVLYFLLINNWALQKETRFYSVVILIAYMFSFCQSVDIINDVIPILFNNWNV